MVLVVVCERARCRLQRSWELWFVLLLFLLDLGPGATACGMGIELNTGYTCYLSAAHRRRGRFFLLLDLGPGAAAGGMGIEINTGYSCYLSAARRRRGRFFLLLDLGPGAAAGGRGIKINTVYNCYLSADIYP